MKIFKVSPKAVACLFFGTIVTAYSLPQQHEKQAEPAKQEARPQQREQRAQQPQQAQPQQREQRAQQPQQAQPQQREQRPQQPQQAQPPQREQRAQQPQQAQPQQREQRPQQPQQAQPQQRQQRAQQPQQVQPQQQQQRAQQPQQAQPQQQQQRAQQPSRQAPQQQQSAQQRQGGQNARYTPPQRSVQQAQSWQQNRGWRQEGWQGRATFQENRSSHWASDHRSWGQRGGYGGYYIPEASFGLYFGVGHWFRIGSQPFIVGGYPRFRYGGYQFMMVDPWPEDWGMDWYSRDEVYVGYDNGYYLFNRMHPDEGVALTVVM